MYLLRFFIVFFILFPLKVYSDEENPSACDCSTIVTSTQEQLDGCPARIKSETCPQFREIEQWQTRLRNEQELRQFERRMSPVGAGPRGGNVR